MRSLETLFSRFDAVTGEIAGVSAVQRHLSDMRGCYADNAACEEAVRAGNPLVYTVSSFEPGSGPGDLHYGIGRIMPGKVGAEYYMTKGHFHAWREAAEIYIGLAGEGMMLLEDESSESLLVPLRAQQVVYVPGHNAHRTMNVGTVPLTYLGVYPAKAGHDYRAIAARNFSKVLIEREGKPALMDRAELSPGGRLA